MALRDGIAGDIDEVFFDEFAGRREINGNTVPVIEDSAQMAKYRREGIFQGTLLLYLRSSDFPSPPEPGQPMLVDRVKWWVESCTDDMGVLEVALTRYRIGGRE